MNIHNGLSTKAWSSLRLMGLNTNGYRLSEEHKNFVKGQPLDSFLKIRGCGMKTAIEIKRYVGDYNPERICSKCGQLMKLEGMYNDQYRD
jgi:hypothetical protein